MGGKLLGLMLGVVNGNWTGLGLVPYLILQADRWKKSLCTCSRRSLGGAADLQWRTSNLGVTLGEKACTLDWTGTTWKRKQAEPDFIGTTMQQAEGNLLRKQNPRHEDREEGRGGASSHAAWLGVERTRRSHSDPTFGIEGTTPCSSRGGNNSVVLLCGR